MALKKQVTTHREKQRSTKTLQLHKHWSYEPQRTILYHSHTFHDWLQPQPSACLQPAFYHLSLMEKTPLSECVCVWSQWYEHTHIYMYMQHNTMTIIANSPHLYMSNSYILKYFHIWISIGHISVSDSIHTYIIHTCTHTLTYKWGGEGRNKNTTPVLHTVWHISLSLNLQYILQFSFGVGNILLVWKENDLLLTRTHFLFSSTNLAA